MKRFVFYVGGLLLMVFGGMALVNYFVDPGHIYKTDYIDQIAEGIKKGYNVEGVTNYDERLLKLKLSEVVFSGKTFDYIAFGSSRIMTLSEDVLSGQSLLNMGVSGCKFEDIVSLYQICKNYNIKYNNVIIAVDPTFFNDNDDDERWKTLESYYCSYFGKKYEYTPSMSNISNLIDPSYFQSSITALINGKQNLRYVSTIINDGFTVRNQGAIYYDKAFRERPQEKIDQSAITWKHGSYMNFNEISMSRVEMFEQLMEHFKQDCVNVMFFKSPFHPLFFNRVMEMKGATQAMHYVDDYANKNDIKIIGSFNPEEVNFKNTDFYDAPHARKESLDKMNINDLGNEMGLYSYSNSF